jgi:hypothetical protein
LAIREGALINQSVFEPFSILARRAVPVLSLAGIASGVLLLRDFQGSTARRRVSRLLTTAILCLGLALVVALSYSLIQSARFATRVMAPQFNRYTDEDEVRALLGRPTSAERAPGFLFGGNSMDCIRLNAARNLVYIQPGGGSYRVIYFDSDGKYLCDTTGAIAY